MTLRASNRAARSDLVVLLMTYSHSQRPSRAISDSPSPCAKVAREDILYLEGEAELCPQVFCRVLDRLALLGLIPLSIDYRRGKDGLWFSIQIDGLTAERMETTAYKLEALPMVRSITFGQGCPDASESATNRKVTF